MSAQSITVSARVGFACVNNIAERLNGVDFPIELALPYRYDWWQEAVVQFDEMMVALESANVNVCSVHATQANISDERFLNWGWQTIEIAERLGAKTITVHPNRSRKSRENLQEEARIFIRRLQRETNVPLSVETFSGKDRIFRPDEIISARLPMTLDTAHIHDNDRIMEIIDSYWRNIPVVHLSARDQHSQHLPIDIFCIQVIEKLVKLEWSGDIALEYLPWHHYRLRPDMEVVQQALIRDIKPEEIVPVCNAYEARPEMWNHNTPEPDINLKNI